MTGVNPPNLQMTAAQVVLEVVDRGRSLERALATAQTPGASRARMREICYGGCRHYHYFDGILARLLSKPIDRAARVVHFILVNACHQIQFMRTPEYAAVNESVGAVAGTRFAWAGGLINGVLRNFLRRRAQLTRDLAEAARFAFPAWLHGEIRAHWPRHFQSILHASNRKPPLTLRVNRRKISRGDYLRRLAESGIAAQPTADSALGVTLRQALPVERIPGFADGLASVQDEAAQLAPVALGLNAGERVLDGCAAPGGKTGLLLEAQPAAAVVAVDLPARIEALHQNLARLGFNTGGGVEVVAGDLTDAAAWWDGRRFQRLVLDVPCSGTGVIRRHPDIKHRRRPEDIARFAAQQLNLLIKAWPLLDSGGILLYVTCSILPAENDAVVEQFTGRQADAAAQTLNAPPGVATPFGRQRLPGVHPGDGFYFCQLKKTAPPGA